MVTIINKNQTHGNDLKLVERKQDCALSEKERELHAKLSRMLKIRKKRNAANQKRVQDC